MKNDNQQKAFSQPFTRRDFLSTSLKAGTAAFTTGLLPKLRADAGCQYNVLFIIADDLRPLLGCYGHPEMHTPNIDRLAQRGTLFKRAYCQYPLCNPSRVSMITGLRPETTGVYGNAMGWREALPEVVTLPQHFKIQGYHTRSVGKIAHADRWHDTLSWSAPIWSQQLRIDRATIPSWQVLDVADDELLDGRIASASIEILTQVKDQQFFLAVGFHKPHLPYNVPRKYYDLYDIETFKDASSIKPPSQNDLRDYADIPDGNTRISEKKTLELMRGYAASTSYMDAQVGRVVQHLDTLGISRNTVIVFTSDHGFHLGEHENWGKSTLFEAALRSPLIVSVPGHQLGRTDALVELVDIYPTLCDACRLPIPSQLEGLSLMPVIEQPTRPWKTAVFSQTGGRGNYTKRYSIRTARYQYIELNTGRSQGRELYDYDTDPDETVNIVDLPENVELVAHLSERLHAGWRGALPDMEQQISVPQTLPWDINNDGIVNIQDLILVSNSFGKETLEYPKADVNNDGHVDIIDLLLIAAHFGESCTTSAPSKSISISQSHVDSIAEWLAEAYQADDGSDVFRHGIANLEALFNNVVPQKTTLLPNFPNPFNPETWIPYDLAQDANVDIKIYNLKGETIREFKIGFQNAGTYRTKELAAFWDGRNSTGELVASGLYFYSLNAGQSKAIRQMVIRK